MSQSAIAAPSVVRSRRAGASLGDKIFAACAVIAGVFVLVLLGAIIVSLFIISTYWSRDAFNFMLDMCSVMSLLPYLLVAGYGVLVARGGVGYEETPGERGRDQIFAGIAAVYTIFMFVAAGLKYVLLMTVLFAPGTVLYLWARREQNARLFTPVELGIFIVVLIGAAIGLYGLVTGLITP